MLPAGKGGALVLRIWGRHRKAMLVRQRKTKRPAFEARWRCLADDFRGASVHVRCWRSLWKAKWRAFRRRKARMPAGADDHSKGKHHA